MKKKFKKIILAITLTLGVSAIITINDLVYADWQTIQVSPVAVNDSYTLNDPNNAIAFSHHNFPELAGQTREDYPNVVRVNTYNDIYAPLRSAFYMRIPLNDVMRDNASSYLGVDRTELQSQQDLVVVIQRNFGILNDTVELRPQWVFADYVPKIGTPPPPGTGNQNQLTPHNVFNLFAKVNMDARVFGPDNGVVSNPIRYDQEEVSFHDKFVGANIWDKWYQTLSPDNLHIGFPKDNRCRAVLSYVDFNAGLLGHINHTQVGTQAIPKQLTLNILAPNNAWRAFRQGATNGYTLGQSVPSPIGDILLHMYGQRYISREVMYYLLGFEEVILDSVLPLTTAPIHPASLRSNAGGGQTNSSTSATSTPRSSTPQGSTSTPTFSVSSGIPTSPLDENTLEVYRTYNPNGGEHHYTMQKGEVDALVTVGWRDEGVAFKCSADGVPVNRLYNPNSGIHHFTIDTNERDALVALGWHDEGIAWYARRDGTVPVFRIYNPGNGEHVWTTSHAEVENAVNHGWNYEGIAWYIR